MPTDPPPPGGNVPVYTPNSRKFLHKNAVPVELWATGVQINYNPVGRKARVLFTAVGLTAVNGVVLQIPEINDHVEADLSAQVTRCFGYGFDPVTGADLSKISVAGLDKIISCAFDSLHNERALAAPSIPVTSPPPAPTPAPNIEPTTPDGPAEPEPEPNP